MSRKIIFVISSLLILMFSVGVFAQQYSYDYKNMKMDEYWAELSKWQKREADAKAAIAEQEAQIAQLQEQIAAAEQQHSDCWNEIYTMLETDKSGYDSYLSEAKKLEEDLASFGALSPEEIYNRRNELQEYMNRLAELRKDKRSLGPEPYQVLQRVENMLGDAEKKATPAAAGRYEVQRGDYLWKIAKNPDVYGDPYAWMRIYTSNRDQISNPDLIYPQQVFRIPRVAGPNEHWVERGESLFSIAQRYGSPFTWQRIYEANKDVISDANLIYPHMVLSLPGQ